MQSHPSPRCPRCHHPRVHRWGGFAGRQRYRCVACTRTFSTYTGTALHYLKRVDRWAGFLRAMDRSRTIRETAALLGLHKDTVFRWRHRFLAVLGPTEQATLHGEVVVAELTFAHSRKGARRPETDNETPDVDQLAALDGAPVRRPPVWVLIARDERGLGAGSVLGDRRPSVERLHAFLGTRVAPGTVLVGGRGRYSPLALCATRLGLRYQVPAPAVPGHRTAVTPRELKARLRRWIQRFRGVATKYLDHYLLWFRALECRWSDGAWDLGVVGMG